MRSEAYSSSIHIQEKSFVPSDELLGFEKASILFYIGGGCLLLVLIFGIILCRLDISAGKRRRGAQGFQQVEH